MTYVLKDSVYTQAAGNLLPIVNITVMIGLLWVRWVMDQSRLDFFVFSRLVGCTCHGLSCSMLVLFAVCDCHKEHCSLTQGMEWVLDCFACHRSVACRELTEMYCNACHNYLCVSHWNALNA